MPPRAATPPLRLVLQRGCTDTAVCPKPPVRSTARLEGPERCPRWRLVDPHDPVCVLDRDEPPVRKQVGGGRRFWARSRRRGARPDVVVAQQTGSPPAWPCRPRSSPARPPRGTRRASPGPTSKARERLRGTLAVEVERAHRGQRARLGEGAEVGHRDGEHLQAAVGDVQHELTVGRQRESVVVVPRPLRAGQRGHGRAPLDRHRHAE